MEISLFLCRKKATSCAFNPLVSLSLQYNTSSNIYSSARERENHCARVVRISLLSHGVNDMTDAKSIYSSLTYSLLLSYFVSFTLLRPLFLRPMCIDGICFIFFPYFLFSIYLFPIPRYKRASAVRHQYTRELTRVSPRAT